ncbi:hypothetical protein [Treponema sp.]|uniref:hypothetical protein n=1 Tax=Treponema sp. TaxID=166 RepID=UPI00298DC0C6|nr:hypothetical protein [Treponema sp.]MCQ2240305.1 hypothetical protein [Treponema sp.]
MKARYHLPGLFEFYDLYKIFLPLFFKHRNWFYDWCEIGSIYGAPADCLWGGGRVGFGLNGIEKEVLSLCREFNVSARLAFSNSLIEEKHLSDEKCNRLCSLFSKIPGNGIIVHSDLLLDYIKNKYPSFYFVSSTTKVLSEFNQLENELNRTEFKYVVPDFRLNKDFENLFSLDDSQKSKVEFLCNECCLPNCSARKTCYENVSRKNLGLKESAHRCVFAEEKGSYSFSRAMENPVFIGINDIQENYLKNGFSEFKIEGRSLGSALVLEFLLYYLTKPEFHIHVRENIYLDNTLDLF